MSDDERALLEIIERQRTFIKDLKKFCTVLFVSNLIFMVGVILCGLGLI